MKRLRDDERGMVIVTAVMLLMIMVSILNIIFFWVPLFKICLPKAGD